MEAQPVGMTTFAATALMNLLHVAFQRRQKAHIRDRHPQALGMAEVMPGSTVAWQAQHVPLDQDELLQSCELGDPAIVDGDGAGWLVEWFPR